MKLKTLKQYFGHEFFREGQELIIDSILSGRDVVGIMPTGAGKSICYQLPAIISDGITFVVSPLISLMKDQVGALKENGIAAAYINSTLSNTQIGNVIENARNGIYKLLYIAPERLDTPDFIKLAADVKISMIAVDEAHCVSQWGQDFRPSYRKITEFINKLSVRPAIAAFTATATDEVKQDIINILELINPLEIVTGFNRENLYFEVREPQDKYEAVLDYIKSNRDKSGIIYCSTRENTEQVCARLNNDGYNATRYHAGLSDTERKTNQDDFLYDKKAIMVATNAFGMGIDKSNVSFVIHYNMPKNIESYYQEAGRAGRDGAPADCILLYGGKDVITNQYFIENTNEQNDLPPEIIEQIKIKDRERLKIMTYYCHTKDCLREYILKYFKDVSKSNCGNCFNCHRSFEQIDITEFAQKILSCIWRMGERFGIKMIIDTLRGSKSEKVLSFRLNELKTYGIMKEISEKNLREMINYLVLNGYIQLTNSEFPTAKLTIKSNDVLFNGEKLYMKSINGYEKKEAAQKNPKSKTISKALKQGYEINKELFMSLKELRTNLASAQRVPAYVIFSDSALIDMCLKMPADENEFLKVSGVGEVKLQKYGKDFLSVINMFEKKEAQPDTDSINTSQLIEYISKNYQLTEYASITELSDRAAALITAKTSKAVALKKIRDCIKDFLIKHDLISIESHDGKNIIKETARGKEAGIVTVEKIGRDGIPFGHILYSEQIQLLIKDNINIILENFEQFTE